MPLVKPLHLAGSPEGCGTGADQAHYLYGLLIKVRGKASPAVPVQIANNRKVPFRRMLFFQQPGESIDTQLKHLGTGDPLPGQNQGMRQFGVGIGKV